MFHFWQTLQYLWIKLSGTEGERERGGGCFGLKQRKRRKKKGWWQSRAASGVMRGQRSKVFPSGAHVLLVMFNMISLIKWDFLFLNQPLWNKRIFDIAEAPGHHASGPSLPKENQFHVTVQLLQWITYFSDWCCNVYERSAQTLITLALIVVSHWCRLQRTIQRGWGVWFAQFKQLVVFSLCLLLKCISDMLTARFQIVVVYCMNSFYVCQT